MNVQHVKPDSCQLSRRFWETRTPRDTDTQNRIRPWTNSSVSDFLTSLKRILTNKILVFNSASNSFFILGLIGYWTFMPKYMETQFRQTAANSNFASGAIGILSSGLGIVTSGVVISKFKPSPRTLAMWNFVSESLEVLGHVAYIFLGCAPEDLHGRWNEDKTLVSEQMVDWFIILNLRTKQLSYWFYNGLFWFPWTWQKRIKVLRSWIVFITL